MRLRPQQVAGQEEPVIDDLLQRGALVSARLPQQTPASRRRLLTVAGGIARYGHRRTCHGAHTLRRGAGRCGALFGLRPLRALLPDRRAAFHPELMIALRFHFSSGGMHQLRRLRRRLPRRRCTPE
jgi:hypothetical protein